MLPIIGTYLIDKSPNHSYDSLFENNKNLLKTLVYPVPPSQATKGVNFLGVHTTITSDGKIKIGPTALPCFWREQHLGLSSFNFQEFFEIMKLYFKILISDKRFLYLNLFRQQIKYQFSSKIIEDGKDLVKIYDNLEKNLFGLYNISNRFEFKTGGVRSQILNAKSLEMENDFLILKKSNHIHLLNMISPGWTSSLAIAEDINFD